MTALPSYIARSVAVVLVGELRKTGLEFLLTALALFVDDPETRKEQIHVELGGFGGSKRNGNRRFMEHRQNPIGRPSSDTVTLEQPGDTPPLQASPAVGAGHVLDQLPEPWLMAAGQS